MYVLMYECCFSRNFILQLEKNKKLEKEKGNKQQKFRNPQGCVCVFVFNRSRNCFKPSYSDMRKMCPQLYQTGDL